jgi:16S rRNA (guanine1207-N2)-methyltransferase
MVAWIAAARCCWSIWTNCQSGHLLDFGCGAGVLGAAVKRRYPHNRVTLLDVDAFAAASQSPDPGCQRSGSEVITGDGIDAAPMGLSAILSNPPFHVGVHTDYFATENLLRKAAKHLKRRRTAPGGEQLPEVPATDRRASGRVRDQGRGQGFRIYRATRG